MKKSSFLLLISLICLLPLLLDSCRSGREATVKPDTGAGQPAWVNVTVPVKVSIVKPQRFSFSGTATLVRDEYVLVSLRFLGFEVGQIYVTPQTADVVIKQPSKIWMQTDVAGRLRASGLTFAGLQEVLMGNREFADRLPAGLEVTFGGIESNPEVMLTGSVKGKPVEASLSWNLDNAKWNSDSPRTFSPPGSSYRKTSLEALLKSVSTY